MVKDVIKGECVYTAIGVCKSNCPCSKFASIFKEDGSKINEEFQSELNTVLGPLDINKINQIRNKWETKLNSEAGI